MTIRRGHTSTICFESEGNGGSHAGKGCRTGSMKLSVVVPAHNEDHCIESTLRAIHDHLRRSQISHEILVINDNSSDRTEEVLRSLQNDIPTLKYVNNSPPHGYGFAVRKGMAHYTGDAVAICMADAWIAPPILSHSGRRWTACKWIVCSEPDSARNLKSLTIRGSSWCSIDVPTYLYGSYLGSAITTLPTGSSFTEGMLLMVCSPC